MDRFKFRVWDIKRNSYDSYYNYKIGTNGRLNHYPCWTEKDGRIVDGNIEDNFIVEQCTGLKDKNGKLIYEGDIVDIGGHGYRIEYIEGFITFCPFTDQEWNWYKRGSNHFKYCMDGDDYRAGKNHFLFQYESYELDIIGNIHENPELLEQA